MKRLMAGSRWETRQNVSEGKKCVQKRIRFPDFIQEYRELEKQHHSYYYNNNKIWTN